MKYILWLALITPILFSCTEDKGNYDYIDLNEVEIDGIEDDYLRLYEGNLIIEPEISQTLHSDESSLEYLWTIVNENLYVADIDTLSKEKNLDYQNIQLNKGKYILRLKVTDVSQDLYWDFQSSLKVATFPDGLQILSNTNGNAQFSVLRSEDSYDYEAYKFVNNEYAGKNPLGILAVNEVFTGNDNLAKQFMIVCDDERFGVICDNTKLKRDTTIIECWSSYTDKPNSIRYAYTNVGSDFNGIHIGDENNVYVSMKPYRNDFPNFNSIYERRIASKLFFTGWSDGYSTRFMYDQNTTGFVFVDYWGYGFDDCVNDEGNIFDVSNTGLKALYGKTIGGMDGEGFGVFMDENSEEKYILQLNVDKAAIKPMDKFLIVGDNIEEAENFEFCNTKKILFYSYSNKLYTYDLLAKQLLYTYSFEEGSTVNHFEVNSDDKKIYVGISDDTMAEKSGSVYIIKLDSDGELLETIESHEKKFGKIVDINDNYYE